MEKLKRPQTRLSNDGDSLLYAQERCEHAIYEKDRLRQKEKQSPVGTVNRLVGLEVELNRIRHCLGRAISERDEVTAERDKARELCVMIENQNAERLDKIRSLTTCIETIVTGAKKALLEI